MISLHDLEFLQSTQGEALLDDLATEDLVESRTLPLLTRLRKTYTPQQASAALAMARLRANAITKFGDDAQRMFFTDAALQQASDPLVRQYRAQGLDVQSIADMCCGIGADSLAFAQNGLQVLGIDIDPVRIAVARLNAEALTLPNVNFAVRDVLQVDVNSYEAVFFDPARRDDSGRRIFDVERYIPPLSVVQGWANAQVIVKLAPGVELAQLAPYGGRLEFISVSGDLKEAVLWLGEGPLQTKATLLTPTATHHWLVQDVDLEIDVSPPLGWLLEPDPAMIRSGGLRELAMELGASLIDETIAYMTCADSVESPWVRRWQILDWMPFNLKKLRAYLRERDIGHITVKKRGSPITPEQLIKKLKLKGEQSCTLVLTQHHSAPIVIVCADYTS